MHERTSVLESQYIIDGVRMDATPKMMLEAVGAVDACASAQGDSEVSDFEPVVDESVDLSPAGGSIDEAKAFVYLEEMKRREDSVRECPLEHPEAYAKSVISNALTDALWRQGHFRLEDLALEVKWNWSDDRAGAMTAFYKSVDAICEWTDSLGIRLETYRVDLGKRREIEAVPGIASIMDIEEDGDETVDLSYRTVNARLGRKRKVSEKIEGNKSNWLIYIPFDTCAFNLGGSRFEDTAGVSCGKAPFVEDGDYFIDCYEVVREFAEDGILLSASSTGNGGLLAALDRMASEKGISFDPSVILSAYGGASKLDIMFAEVPGVVIEISDNDYDYIDAELLLQDVAYYPIGHPSEGVGVDISSPGQAHISGILQSLLTGSALEGED